MAVAALRRLRLNAAKVDAPGARRAVTTVLRTARRVAAVDSSEVKAPHRAQKEAFASASLEIWDCCSSVTFPFAAVGVDGTSAVDDEAVASGVFVGGGERWSARGPTTVVVGEVHRAVASVFPTGTGADGVCSAADSLPSAPERSLAPCACCCAGSKSARLLL